MKFNDRITTTVLDMNSEGYGICKHKGIVIFVPGAVKGDTVHLKITGMEKNYASAVCLEIAEKSGIRREPACPNYQKCGGCTLQHITREAELSVKENTVKQALRRMHLDNTPEVFKPIRAGKETGYRNKAIFHVDAEGKLGYFARESHDVMPGSGWCRLLPKVFSEIAATVEAFLQEWPEDLPLVSLYLRRNQENKCTVCLQTEEKLTPKLKEKLMEYVQLLYRHHGDVLNGVLNCDHPKGKYAVPQYSVLKGDRYLYETFHGLTMRLSPEGFCQVNHEGAEILADTVMEYATEAAGNKKIIAADLYCGSGFFGLQLAKTFPDWQIYGIEINKDSIRDADVNRELNKLDNIQFVCGDAAELAAWKTKPDFIVIDPPRAGCSPKMCTQLLEIMPENIVYVSCNPQTLARDLVRICEGGYEIKTVQPVDMFPGTEHVETVVLMSKKG